MPRKFEHSTTAKERREYLRNNGSSCNLRTIEDVTPLSLICDISDTVSGLYQLYQATQKTCLDEILGNGESKGIGVHPELTNGPALVSADLKIIYSACTTSMT